jgi:hypothetical protein
MFIYVRSVLAVMQVSLGGGRDADLLHRRWPYAVHADGHADGIAVRPRGLRRLLHWAQVPPAWFGAAVRGTWSRAVESMSWAVESMRRRDRPAGTDAGPPRAGGAAPAVAAADGGVRGRLARLRSRQGRSVAV